MARRSPGKPRPSSPAFELVSPEDLRAEAVRLANGLAAAAVAQIDRFTAEPDSAIHETRLVAKRFRALLRLLRHTLSERWVRAEDERLRQASRLLARARDTTVGLKTLGALGHDLHGQTASAVRLVQRRFSLEARRQKTSADAIARRLRSAVSTIRRTADSLSRARLRQQGWPAIEPALHAGYRRVRRRYKAAHTDDSDEAFHRWRTSAKAFMYQLHLLRPAAPKRIGSLLEDWNRLQQVLGDEHDLAVLRVKVGTSRNPPTESTADKTTTRAIAGRQQRLRKEALKLGRRILAMRSGEFTRRLHQDWRRWRKRP